MAASHDQSKRSADTTNTSTQNNVAASEQSQTVATVTTGNRNHVTDNRGSVNTAFDNKGDVTVNSLDPETISGAFGLTKDVVENLANLANGYVEHVSQTSERNTAEVANAFEHFGAELSTVTQRQVDAFTPDAGKDKIITTLLVVGGVVWLAALLRKKP